MHAKFTLHILVNTAVCLEFDGMSPLQRPNQLILLREVRTIYCESHENIQIGILDKIKNFYVITVSM
jgi:hypothetical protein